MPIFFYIQVKLKDPRQLKDALSFIRVSLCVSPELF